MEGLIEGRIVHYVAYNNRHLAGMIIGVENSLDENGVCDLVVFTNMQNAAGHKNFGVQFHQEVMYNNDPMPLPGTWHWPERA